jgi:hypothetical protein
MTHSTTSRSSFADCPVLVTAHLAKVYIFINNGPDGSQFPLRAFSKLRNGVFESRTIRLCDLCAA